MAQRDEPGTDFADRPAIVLAEVGDRLVIRRQAAGQPHDLHVATGFPFKAPARLDPVEVAVDIELQQNRRLIARPTRRPWRDPAKTKGAKIKLVDKNIDYPNRVFVTDPVIQTVRKQGDLAAINALDKTLHQKIAAHTMAGF